MESVIRRCLITILVSILFVSLNSVTISAAETDPVLNEGKKWRIGYLEGGPYVNYQGTLKSIITNLMSMGWIEKSDLPELPDLEDTRALWEWLSTPGRSRYLTFVEDGYWSSNWKKDKRAQKVEEIKKRISNVHEFDLLIAMGTWAGQDMVSITNKIPVMVMSCSDPVKAKIIKSVKDSGQDNVHAWCDPTRGERRLRLFHDVLGFNKLGVIYENTEDGRIYADLTSIQKVSGERGFETVECEALETGLSLQTSRDNVARCINKLAQRIDALIISDHRGLHPKNFPELINPLLKEGIPVFTAVRGPTLVKRGVLMGIAREDYQPLGGFYAETMARIFNGSSPRDLTQIYEEPLKLAINLEAARILGYEVPPNIKKIADIIYSKIDRSLMEQ